jgi:hypothetical protein
LNVDVITHNIYIYSKCQPISERIPDFSFQEIAISKVIIISVFSNDVEFSRNGHILNVHVWFVHNDEIQFRIFLEQYA